MKSQIHDITKTYCLWKWLLVTPPILALVLSLWALESIVEAFMSAIYWSDELLVKIVTPIIRWAKK